MAHFPTKPEVRAVEVPVALLRSKELTSAAKFVWIRMRLDELRQRVDPANSLACLRHPHHPRRLAKRTGLARSTVYEALRRLEASGWLVPGGDSSGTGIASDRGIVSARAAGGEAGTRREQWSTARPRRGRQATVWIPTDLIRFAHALRSQAILCYGLLQSVFASNGSGRTGTFKWAELETLTGMRLRSLKRAVRALVDTRWLQVSQRHRKAPIWFRLQHADEAYREAVRQYLERATYRGEALMRSYLSLIADTRECEDGARPEFLVNPASGERMELDRYYPVHRVAFEFNGPQHYVATGRFTKQEVVAQRKRDHVKRRICKEKGIELLVVHAEDLSLVGMLRKVGALLPRKALRGLRQTIRFLNRCGQRYREAVGQGSRAAS